MMRPTPKAVLYFAVSIPAALLIVVIMPATWYVALYLPVIVLAAMLLDWSLSLLCKALTVKHKTPVQLHVGQTAPVKLTLTAEHYKHMLPVEVLLEQTGEADAPQILRGVMHNGRLEMELPVTPRRRGRVHIIGIWLRWKGPWGLIEHWRKEDVNKAVDVVPDVKGIHEAALQFFARDAVYGVKSQRMVGEGTEFEDLREYAQGMDNRLIDWKRSARHRKLLCKEFRQERNHQIVLGFDTGHLMLEPIDGMPKLDHAIKAGLLMGWVSLYSGDLVGGCGFDVSFRSFIKPNRGMPYFTQFQRFTAGLDYHTEETNFTLGLAELNTRLNRRALVILFTEFVDSISAELLIESLQIMARKHVVIFVTMKDPLLQRLQATEPAEFGNIAEAVIADDFLRERAVVLERIARLGVHCLDVPAHQISAALINRYLLIKQRGLL